MYQVLLEKIDVLNFKKVVLVGIWCNSTVMTSPSLCLSVIADLQQFIVSGRSLEYVESAIFLLPQTMTEIFYDIGSVELHL